jgi:hypothetical protein
MRNGILLAEDAPQSILTHFEVDSLEEAFLQLCMRHGVSDEADQNHLKQVKTFSNQQLQITDGSEKSVEKSDLKRRNSIDSDKIETCCGGVGDITCNKKSFMKNLQFTTKRRMKALLTKNFLQMIRQPAGMVFLLFFPIFQLVCFYVAVGGNPIGLNIAIVDDELSSYKDCTNSSLITTYVHDYTCDLHKVSCRFINQINDSVAIKHFYSTFDEAYADAKRSFEGEFLCS